MEKFVKSAVFVFVITAGLKLLAATGEHGLLGAKDPLFTFVTTRQLMILTAVLEIGLVVLLTRPIEIVNKLLLIGAIASSFAFYRVVLLLIGYTGPCACLGSLTAWMGLTDAQVMILTGAIAAYLLFGSYICLCREVFRQGRPLPTQP